MARIRIVGCGTVVACLIVGACGGSSPSPTGPTSSQSVPSAPNGGVDSGWKYLVDGAGNQGPVRVRVTYVNPPPGSAFSGLVSFKSEICMDPVPNPTNSRYLSEMRIAVYGSPDGVRPNGVTSAAFGVAGNAYTVRNGECVNLERMPVSQGGKEGEQFILFQPGDRHLVFTARYWASDWYPEKTYNWSPDACPSLEDIARLPAQDCVLRSRSGDYDLGYR